MDLDYLHPVDKLAVDGSLIVVVDCSHQLIVVDYSLLVVECERPVVDNQRSEPQ